MGKDNQCIITYTGRRVYPTRPSPKMICIEDIAHALANKCRFTGHTKTFYSVAQHSVVVDTLWPYGSLWGLLHDAAEAYLPDVASTLKECFPTLVMAERFCMEAIAKRFSLPPLSEAQKKTLKMIDKAVLRVEYNALINNPHKYPLGIGRKMKDVPILKWKPFGFWVPVEAERVFLKVFYEQSSGHTH